MADEKLWWILEFALRDLELPHHLLTSLILCLPFPVNSKLPSHIQRLFHLRYLLSTASSHRLLSPFTLTTLERLLPPPTSPPSPSLCTAYSSHLFYLSTAPGFSLEIAAVLSRLSNYCFSMKLLEPWRAMIAKQERIKSCPINRVLSARDKAIFALREFVDEEIRAMEPPFLMRSVQELSGGYLSFLVFFLLPIYEKENCQLYTCFVFEIELSLSVLLEFNIYIECMRIIQPRALYFEYSVLY